MSRWPHVPFLEYVHVYQPATLAAKQLDVSGPYAVFGANGRIGVHSQYNHSDRELLLGCRGSVGSVNWSEPKSWVNGNAMVVRPDPEYLDREFVYHLLKGGVDLSAAISGTAQPQITRSSLGQLMIPFPPLDEQKRIVAKVDEISGCLTALSGIQLELSQEESALRAAWLKTLMRPDDSWSDACLGHIADIFDGPHATPRKVKDGPWFLSIASLCDGEVDLQKSAHISAEDFAEWTRRTQVRKGDTLFSYETRLGQAGFWSHSDPAALGRRMGLLRPKPNVVPRFLTLLYLSPSFQSEIVKRTSRGATVDRIPIRDMGEWLVRIPPLERQHKIVEAFDDVKHLHTRLNDLVARRHELVDKLRHASLTACLSGDR